MSRYTIGNKFYPKYDITKSMVGPLPLAPHHDYLQYMYHANGVKTMVLQIYSALFKRNTTQLLPKITSFPVRLFGFLIFLDFFKYFEKLEKD